jgi:hypothetical protein
MNRRSFLKFLGIGAATAAVAPKVLVYTTPEVYPEANYPITLEMVQKAYSGTLTSYPRAGRYMYVRLAPTSLPVSAGDVVYYKNDKLRGVLGYKAKKWRDGVLWGYGIGNFAPGNYGFIQIAAAGDTFNTHTMQLVERNRKKS